MSNAVWDWSSVAASNNATPPYGWPAGMNGSQVEPTGRQMMATLSESVHSVVAGGTADALTATFANAPAALTDGMEVNIRASAANATTTPTLNVNGLGALTITKFGGTVLSVGDIAGSLHELKLRYNSAHTRWELLNPATVPGSGVSSIADATNGGLQFSSSTGNVTAKIYPPDLAQKLTPTASDEFFLVDASTSPQTCKVTPLPNLFAAFMNALTNSLGADVALNNNAAYFDGPSVSQGTSGTWLCIGAVTVGGESNGEYFAKLWDGTTVIDSRTVSVGSGQTNPVSIPLCGVITSPAGNIRISVKEPNGTSGSIYHNASGNGKDSTLTVIRVG